MLSADLEPPPATTTREEKTITKIIADPPPQTPPTPPLTNTTPPVQPQPPLTLGATARVRGGAVLVRVGCASAAPCQGEIVVRDATRRVTYARGRVTLAAGGSAAVAAKLTKAGRRAVRRRSRVTAIAAVTLGGRAATTRKVLLRR
jgi:hypothetical protein